MGKKRSGYSKKGKDWLGRPIVEHFNAKGEKTGYNKRSTTLFGTPITERYNSKGEKTGHNKRSTTLFGTPITERYNSEGKKTGYDKRSTTLFGTSITEHVNSKGEATGYSKEGSTFWGNPIIEHYNKRDATASRRQSLSGFRTTLPDTAGPVSEKHSIGGWVICAFSVVAVAMLFKAFIPTILTVTSDQAEKATPSADLLPKKLEGLPASRVFVNAPTGPLLTMETSHGLVRIKNFYTLDPLVMHGGVVILKKADNYVISYEPENNDPNNKKGRFWIGIAARPFEQWRHLAEKDFLTTLETTQSDACKLDASVGVIYSPDNPLDGQNFPMSFCTHQ